MALSLKSLGLDKLSVTDRLELMDQLWLSLDADAGKNDIPEWHVHEIERRLADADANPEAVITWAEVKARMEAEL
ncbi:MAG TPA: addiction module protein [Fimbriiglobus sp.]|jgi:putative addiction module component (TIGR02574 family)